MKHESRLPLLLFLLPPSCMVAPIGKSANKLFFSSIPFSNSTTVSNFNNSLPTMFSGMNIGMDIQSGPVLTNNPEVQGRNPLPSNNLSRDPSIGTSGHFTPYCKRMDIDPDIAPSIGEIAYKHFEPSYEMEQEKALRIGKATNQQDTSRPLAINKATPSHVLHMENVINIQLPYDPQAPTEPDL